MRKVYSAALSVLLLAGLSAAHAAATGDARPLEGDYVIHDFHFASGETLPELRMHYT
jgi:homoserine O-acetyltransferase